MKYLQDYMTDRQSEAFKKHKAFFAFGNSQLIDGMKEIGVTDMKELCQLGGGMICPKTEAEALTKELTTIYEESIQQDIKENGLERIVLRELGNHEAGYTGCTESTEDALADYPVTKDDIRKLFRNKNYIIPTTA